MKLITNLCFVILIAVSTASYSAEYFGRYKGEIRVQWDMRTEQMILLSDFSFIDPNNIEWVAKKGQAVDGASIPRALWSIVGSPYTGNYRSASVIHDVACIEKKRTWEVVHLAFYYAMRASGVGERRAKIMYAAVYHFGPRWPIERRIVVAESATRTEVIPATYKTVYESVEVKPASRQWRRAEGYSGPVMQRAKDQTTGEELVLVEVPAVYAQVTRQVVDTPPRFRDVSVLEKYAMATIEPPKQYLSTPDFEKLVEILQSSTPGAAVLSIEEIQNFKP